MQHLGGEPVIIPNGIYVARFAEKRVGPPGTSTSSRSGQGPVISFLGRMDEPRKGLAVLLAAVPEIARARPDVHVRVGGKGDIEAARSTVPAEFRDRVDFLGLPTTTSATPCTPTATSTSRPRPAGRASG